MMGANRLDIGATGEHPSEARLLLALDRELDAPDATRVFEHVRTCAACRATFEGLALLSSEVEAYVRTWPPEPAAVAASAASPRETIWWRRSWRDRASSSLAAWATAAAMVLLIATWLLVARTGRAPAANTAPANATASNATAPLSAPAPRSASGSAPARGEDTTLTSPSSVSSASLSSSPAAQATNAAVIAPMKVRRRPAPAPATAQARPTHYWALPYANGALPLSEGTVVMKVRLSRDQLRLAGIPISESQDTQNQSLVRAKVLVGADGLPRAIAFDQN